MRGLDFAVCFCPGLPRRKPTTRCHQALLRSCLPPASCALLMLMTRSLVWRMCQRLQCESFFTFLNRFTLIVYYISPVVLHFRCRHSSPGDVFNIDPVVYRCVEILISEQFRRYTEKMQNIQELEYAEALAVNQLKLKRQNTVRRSKDNATWEKTCVKQNLWENVTSANRFVSVQFRND